MPGSAHAFEAGRAFRDGWKGFNRNAGTLVGFTVLATVVFGLLQALQYGLIAAGANNPESLGGISVLLFGIALLQAIIGLVISIALLDGGLQSVRGRTLAFRELFAKVAEVPNLIGLAIFRRPGRFARAPRFHSTWGLPCRGLCLCWHGPGGPAPVLRGCSQ